MKRTAKAHWEGDLKEGKGELTTQSDVLTKTSTALKPALPMAKRAPIRRNCLPLPMRAALPWRWALPLPKKGRQQQP